MLHFSDIEIADHQNCNNPDLSLDQQDQQDLHFSVQTCFTIVECHIHGSCRFPGADNFFYLRLIEKELD